MTRSTLATLITATALATVGAAIALPGTAAAAARAELRPDRELEVGTPAQLVVTVDREDAHPPAVRVPDATVHYTGQSTKITIVNGRAARETAFVYTLVPRETGALDVPAIHVGTDTTAPLRATVVAAGSAAAQPTSRDHDTSSATAHEPTRAFIRLDVPKRTLYVGEAVPVRIRAYFRGGVSATLQGAPHVGSSAFTLSQLSDKPEQKQVDIDGVPYLQATWEAVLSPAKPTTDKLSIELPVEIAYRERRAPQPRAQGQRRARPSIRDLLGHDPFAAFGDDDPSALFDDPFFDDPFGGMDTMFDIGAMRQQQLTLRDTATRTRIAELPEHGKPAGFSGAVGSFELSVDAPNGELRVGEPATVTFAVTGTGNFDRVELKGIAASTDWKVYAGKTELTADAGSAVSGTKTFTQTIVPTRDGSLELPAVSLAYFDPTSGTYRTTETKPVTLAVAPAPGGGAADPGLAASSVRDAGMRPNRTELGATRATLVPLIRQDRFWMWPGALAAVTALLLGGAFWRRSAWVRERVRARGVAHEVGAQREKLERAARAGDAATFFDAARTALQLRLAAAWHVAPEAITAADVTARLGERGRAIREVFEQADQISYAHGIATPTALDRWRAIVDAQLATEV